MTPTVWLLVITMSSVPTPTGFWPSKDECFRKAAEAYSANYDRPSPNYSQVTTFCIPVPQNASPAKPPAAPQ